MTGEQRIDAPREKVWAALNDPLVLKDCLPGCQSLEQVAPDRMKAVAAIKVGPIGARFKGEVTLSDINAPNGYRIKGEGQGGVAGFAKGGATVRLVEDGPEATILTYAVDVQIGGKLAQVGGALIDATARQMAAAFFRKFGQRVDAPALEGVAPADALGSSVAPEASAERPSSEPAAPRPSAPVPALAQPAPTPTGWILAAVAAAIVGYLVGRGGLAGGAEAWMALAIGLVVVLAAGAGFLLGRSAGGPVVVIDGALLAQASGNRA